MTLNMVILPHRMIRLEGLSDYRGVGLQRFHCTCKYVDIQWNLSITDTLETEKQLVAKRFPLFRGYLHVWQCIWTHKSSLL